MMIFLYIETADDERGKKAKLSMSHNDVDNNPLQLYRGVLS